MSDELRRQLWAAQLELQQTAVAQAEATEDKSHLQVAMPPPHTMALWAEAGTQS